MHARTLAQARCGPRPFPPKNKNFFSLLHHVSGGELDGGGHKFHHRRDIDIGSRLYGLHIDDDIAPGML
jgi:hypothetical protein